jgi:hypothetical protein
VRLKPFLDRRPDHPASASPLARDDQNGAQAARLGTDQESPQLILRLEAAEAMQINRGLDGIPFSRQAALTPGFQGFRRAVR